VVLLFGVTFLTFPSPGRGTFLYESVSNGAPYLFCGWICVLLVSVAAFIFSKKRLRYFLLSLVSFCCGMHLALPLRDYYHPAVLRFNEAISQLRSDHTVYRALFLHMGDGLQGLLQGEHPDLVAVIGDASSVFDESWCQNQILLPSGTTIFLAARQPCEQPDLYDLGDGDGIPGSLILKFQREQVEVPVFFFHVIPTVDNETSYVNHLAVRRLTTQARHTQNFLMFAGLETTPWTDRYGRLVGGAEAINAAWGRGMRSFYSNKEWWEDPFLTNYVFYKGGVRVLKLEELTGLDGEHKSFKIEFVILAKGKDLKETEQ
ncbi:MAG: hypothetical protein KDD60_03375, partial [Bdellovibrionales bacterium]|nr:hypothetical protein [Bdellovibrionales bacterium]